MDHKANKTKVMVFGTYDLIHPGHRDFFNQAKALAPEVELVVSVATDKNVQRIKDKTPALTQEQRVANLQQIPEVDKVVLGDEDDHMQHIIAERPDIIALGYDQKAYTETLETDLKNAKLNTRVVRLEPFHPEKYKTSLLNQNQ